MMSSLIDLAGAEQLAARFKNENVFDPTILDEYETKQMHASDMLAIDTPSKSWNADICVSNNGDDETADGSRAKPFKTIAKALEKVKYRHITISPMNTSADDPYVIYNSFNVVNRYLTFGSSSTIYIRFNGGAIHSINSHILFEHILIQLGNKTPMIYPNGSFSLQLGSYYGCTISQSVNRDDGSSSYPSVVVYLNQTDSWSTTDSRQPMFGITMTSTTVNDNIRLVEYTYTKPIVFLRYNQSSFSNKSYLINTQTTGTQIGSTGVYVL